MNHIAWPKETSSATLVTTSSEKSSVCVGNCRKLLKTSIVLSVALILLKKLTQLHQKSRETYPNLSLRHLKDLLLFTISSRIPMAGLSRLLFLLILKAIKEQQ